MTGCLTNSRCFLESLGMPEEYRRLVFSDMETVTAVMQQSRRTKDPIPAGKMSYLTIAGDKMPYVSFAIAVEDGEKTFKIEGNVLAAALIRFCIDNRIPIPQKAQKIVSAKDHHIIMDIRQ